MPENQTVKNWLVTLGLQLAEQSTATCSLAVGGYGFLMSVFNDPLLLGQVVVKLVVEVVVVTMVMSVVVLPSRAALANAAAPATLARLSGCRAC